MNRRDFLKTGATTGLSTVVVGTGQGATGPPNDYQEHLDSMDGDGSESNPYVIETVADLQAIAAETDAQYELGSDVDAAETADWHRGSGFSPIGEFTGTFDGKGHEIRGLTIDRSNQRNVGLFTQIRGTVRNLALPELTVAGSENVGGLSGFVAAAKVENIDVAGTVRGTNSVGGLVGYASTDTSDGLKTKIANCTSDCEVQGTQAVGGLAGYARGSAAAQNEIHDCTATGPVTGSTFVGGLLGEGASAFDEPRSVELRNCTASGIVTVDGDNGGHAGGLAGQLEDCAAILSSATGDVDAGGVSSVGGLVGEIQDNDAEVIMSYATGSVRGDYSVGGLIGNVRYGSVEESYATGDVRGTAHVGGLTGYLKEGTVTDCYAHGDVTSGMDAGGIVGEMYNNFGGTTAVRRSLATGSVAGNEADDIERELVNAVGGVVGRKNPDTAVSASYWDTETTGLDWGIGNPRNEGIIPAENGAPTAELQGATASETLTEFDFGNDWQVSGEYPVLQDIEGDGGVATCGVDTATIELDPYPVETGERPTLSLVIPDADSATLRAEYQRPSGETKEIERSLEIEEEVTAGGSLWSTSRPLDSIAEVGTWVDLTIEVEEDGDTCVVENLNNPYLDESSALGYYVFDHVMSVAAILGRFKHQEPSSTTNPDIIARWARARQFDVNRFYGSKRGSMGAVGFDLDVFMNDDDFYRLPKRREKYNGNPLNSARAQFLADLNSAASDVYVGNYDFWVGVHAGEPLNDTAAIYYSNSRVYAPSLLNDAEEDGFWPHEFGHAYGFDHTYNKGLDNHLCVMAKQDRFADRFPSDIPHPAPYSTPLRIADRTGLTTPTLYSKSTHLQDWLTVDATDATFVAEEEWEFPAVTDYKYGDRVPIVEWSRGATTTERFIVESRPFVGAGFDDSDPTTNDITWNRENGASVVYHQTESAVSTGLNISEFHEDGRKLGILDEPGASVTDRVGHGIPNELTFELVSMSDKAAPPSEFSTNVSVTQTTPQSSSQTMAVSGGVSEPEGATGGIESDHRDITPPSLDLHAVDSEGRHVGVTEDGGYENEIPGARASGKRVRGMEWITVPDDADVEFSVRSDDVEQYVSDLADAGYLLPDEGGQTEAEPATQTKVDDGQNDEALSIEAFRERLSVTYRASQTRYGPDAELTSEGDGSWVTDTDIRIQELSLDPGEETNPEPRNERSDLDIQSLDHGGGVDAESVTFEPVAGDDVDVGGWTLSNGQGHTYEFPAETTVDDELVVHSGSGDDVDGELYWGRSEPAWSDDGGTLTVRDADGVTKLAVSYDGRGVVHYGAEPPAASASPWDVPLGTLGLGAGGLVGVAALYAAVRMRSSDADES